MPSLTRESMRELVRAARVARLATVDAAGRPHLVPVCFVLERQPDRVYLAVDHTFEWLHADPQFQALLERVGLPRT